MVQASDMMRNRNRYRKTHANTAGEEVPAIINQNACRVSNVVQGISLIAEVYLIKHIVALRDASVPP